MGPRRKCTWAFLASKPFKNCIISQVNVYAINGLCIVYIILYYLLIKYLGCIASFTLFSAYFVDLSLIKCIHVPSTYLR